MPVMIVIVIVMVVMPDHAAGQVVFVVMFVGVDGEGLRRPRPE